MSKDKSAGKEKSKGKKKLRVNFEGVETRILVPEGQYHAKVLETSEEEGNEHPYIKWVFQVMSDDKTNGAKLFYNTSLAPKSLWNLRNLLETLGVETPDSEFDLDLESYVGLELMVRVEHETYEGKDRAKVTDFTTIEETAEASDDAKLDDEDEGEDEGEESESEEESSDDEGEEESGDDEEGEEESEDESEDEDDGKLTAADIGEMDDSEIADLVKKHKLKVDLASIKKRSKRIAAVSDALEKKGLLK